MAEFEIKLEVPRERAGAVRAALEEGPVQTLQLHAIYLDTDDEVLRRHQLVLRLRKEDDHWVQALKGVGDKPLERLEHEVPVPWPADEEAAPSVDVARHVVRSPAFQDALLGLVGLAHGDALPCGGKGGRKARKLLRRGLDKLYAQCVRDGSKFRKLDTTRQHRVRKRLKRLRYLAEFAAPLFGKSETRAFLARLKPVQDALGLYNDELMALEIYRGMTANDPNAWFGVGWLSARAQPNAAGCQKTMRDFARTRPFWD